MVGAPTPLPKLVNSTMVWTSPRPKALADIEQREGRNAEALKYLKVIHTYVGYSPDSVAIAIKAARATGDKLTEDDMMRFMRANYMGTPQAKEFLEGPQVRETPISNSEGSDS